MRNEKHNGRKDILTKSNHPNFCQSSPTAALSYNRTQELLSLLPTPLVYRNTFTLRNPVQLRAALLCFSLHRSKTLVKVVTRLEGSKIRRFQDAHASKSPSQRDWPVSYRCVLGR